MKHEASLTDGSKRVLLTEHREGQCRAIIGEFGRGEVATYCGQPAISRIDHTGRTVQLSWCREHHRQYTKPVDSVTNSKFMRSAKWAAKV
jgi:hypothetical protein